MKPLVSVLIPTYNRPEYFELALTSVLQQTYNSIEIIVCDNSDNDLTGQVVQKYLSAPNGAQIRYVKNASNIGPIANQQQCLDLATGEYINYLMDDDWFHPDKIETMLPYLLHNRSVSLVTARRQLVDQEGRPGDAVPRGQEFRGRFVRNNAISGRKLGRELLLKRNNYIGEPSCVLFRRSALTGPFGTYAGVPASINVDVATWLNLLARHDAVFLAKPLSYLRIHAGQLSQSPPSRLARLCDWIDHSIAWRKDGLLKDKPFVSIMKSCEQPVLHDIPKWDRRTDGLYAPEVIRKLRVWIEAVEGCPELDGLAGAFMATLARLQRRRGQERS
ncbi:glycosyltransferase family 2 protein [Paenibacillus hodogayensis]|uniref:Glycosyltransferase family 2 protein n=1 Tax=Paenibacillus hodogayensis TaxID=279208 RepID=A0ABV5W1Y7_9BACL